MIQAGQDNVGSHRSSIGWTFALHAPNAVDHSEINRPNQVQIHDGQVDPAQMQVMAWQIPIHRQSVGRL
jgi:hypothetical protein